MSITLQHSTYGSVTITSPEVGDTRDYEDYAAHNNLLSQIETTFKHVDDLYNIIYHFTFKTLTQTMRDDLYTFCTNTAGYRITLTDHLGVAHLGYIISNTMSFVEQGENDFDVNIDFMDISDPDGLDNSDIQEVTLEDCETNITEPVYIFNYFILLEDGTTLLQEDGTELLLETAP